MKITYFDDFKLGVITGDHITDVTAAVRDIPHTGPHDLINGLIARFGEYRKKLVGSSRVDLQACKLEYSIVSPK